MISVKKFQKEVYSYYKTHKRDLPWRPPALKLRRGKIKLDPYKILVSEVMLQQTQVKRVIAFYTEFMKQLPTLRHLARAPLPKVLKLWQGLGYNRRALMLKKTAEILVSQFRGTVPRSVSQLVSLPGVGPSTAAGIMNFAFGIPTPYLETNVRSVYLHFFFADASCKSVSDKEILQKIKQIFPAGGVPRGAEPSTWFYALLDYGVMLKKKHGNPNIRSAHYAKQSPFEGSARQKSAARLRKALKSGVSEKELLNLLK